MTSDSPIPDSVLDTELKRVFAVGRVAGEHLDPDTAAAYLVGELDADEQARVAQHVQRCRACAELVLDIETLSAESGADPEVADLDVASAWRSMRPRLRGEPSRVPRSSGWAPWLAALFAVFAIGLTWRVIQLESQQAGIQANVLFIYLDPVRDSGSTATIPEPEDGVVLLVLTPSSPALEVDYRLDVITEGGQPVFTVDGLRRTEVGTFRVAVPTSSMGAGAYRARLAPSAETSPEAATEYRFAIGSAP